MNETLRVMADAAGLSYGVTSAPELPDPQKTFDEFGNISLKWHFVDAAVECRLNRIETKRDELNAIISLRENSTGDWKILNAAARINLISQSARTALRRELSGRTKTNHKLSHLPWAEMLDQAVTIGGDAAVPPIQPVRLSEIPVTQGTQWVIEPLLEAGGHTIGVAAEGSGKSYFALALGVSVASGIEVISGLTPQITGPVYFLNGETSESNFAQRARAICAGLGIEMPSDLFHSRMVGPLNQSADDHAKFIRANGVKLVVIDSVGMAVDGDLNSAETALKFFQATWSFGDVAIFSVAHPPKDTEDIKSPIGSGYFKYLPRALWTGAASQEPGEPITHAGWFNRKSNNGPLHREIGFRMEFREGIVQFIREDPQTTERVGSKAPVRAQINGVLSAGAVTLDEIAEELPHIDRDTLRRTLNRGTKDGHYLAISDGTVKRYGKVTSHRRDSVPVVPQVVRPVGRDKGPLLRRGGQSVPPIPTEKTSENQDNLIVNESLAVKVLEELEAESLAVGTGGGVDYHN